MVTQKFDLNMIPGKPKPIIRASQYDTGLRVFEVSLFAGTDTYKIPSGATLTVQGTKPDYTGFSYSATYSVNTVTFDCTDQMTACAGAVEMEIAVVNEGKRVATANFVLQVEPAALKDDAIISETDIPIIEQLPEMMEDVNTLISTFGGPNVAETAAEMTDHDKVYVYIGSETGYNSGHWYYYDKTAHVWKDGGIYQSAGVEVDNTLSIGGMAADAKATGDALALKADIASPTFTGDPKAPTASLISYNTQIANTEFVQRLVLPLDDAVNGLEPTEIEMHLVVDGTTGTWAQGGKTNIYDLLPGDNVEVTAGERDAYLVWYTTQGGSEAVNVSTSHTVTAGATGRWGTTDARKLAVLMEDTSGNDVSPASFTINGVEKGLNERVDALETTKQDTLTFDTTPTEGSTNPVTSGGVWEAVQTDKTLAVEDKAADAKTTGNKITELKNDLSSVVNANRSVADAIGVLFPYIVEAGGLEDHTSSKPTVSTYLPDRRAHTSIDYPLILPSGTTITPKPYRRFIVVSTTDGSTYTSSGWQTGTYTISSDSTVYLSLASARSGEPDVLSPEQLAKDYTITFPNGSTGLLGDVAELTSDLATLANTVTNLSTDYNDYKNSIGYPLTQYLDAEEWVNNYYWNGSLNRVPANGYQSIKVTGLKAGKYHFNRMSAPFTWFENTVTGAVQRASTDYGLSDITEETEVTINYNFNLYLTITGSPAAYSVMVTDGKMPDSYLTTAQVYSFDLTEAFKISVAQPIYCGSTRKYTTLKSAIEEATKVMDSTVYVDAETFDLVDEFGSEWLENYSEEANCGLFLKNRVHIIFASGAKVVFNYTGSNEYIQRRFSPFNAGEHGFTLENAYVESTNCRYSVHDERGTAEDAYHNIYKRCTFIHDSTGTTWGSHQCIGGGLGKNGDVLIEDCYMETAGTATTVSYHNSAATNAESKVILKDSYLSSTALISNYGTSTKKTKMIVTNCSLKFDPIISTESQYADNVELVKWNNVIRS